MRFTVTPLGGAQRSVRQIVADIVEYLIPKDSPAATPTKPRRRDGSPARYYADGGDEPGRWFGRGSADLGLGGLVEREGLARVLAGRDPRTGVRLITAQGSAGRRPRLGVGAETRWGDNGDAIYDERDVAAALDLDRNQLDELLAVGTQLAARRVVDALTAVFTGPHHTARQRAPGTALSSSGNGPSSTGADPGLSDGSFLVPVIDLDGHRWITEAELTRFEDARLRGTTPADIAARGGPDDVLALADAARLAGVTPRYLRGLARRYEQHRETIDELVAAGRQPRQAYLVAFRGTKRRWLVRRSDLVDFLRRRHPPAVRAAFDLTLTTEKSLSILALLSEPDTSQHVLNALQEANDWALGWLENYAAATRIQGKTVPVDGWTVASFRHLTSRALDPFAHWHNVIPNTVKAPDGTRRALDARNLYRDAQAASALATAHARWLLTNRLGVRWRPGRKGGWEIDGITDELVTAFSQRRGEIDDALRELEDAIGRGARPDEVEQIVLRTRPAKQQADVDELRTDWWQRAYDLGFGYDDLAACLHRPVQIAEPDTGWLFARLASPDGICRNLSIFAYGDVLAALTDLAIPPAAGTGPQPLLVPADRLEELADQFLRSHHVVPVTKGPNALYTTTEILSVQQRIVTRFRDGLDCGAAQAAGPAIDQALTTHAHLTGEQRRLVRQFCSSGHRIQCAIGYPGAGKTTAMAAAREAWEVDGWRVVGAAVKGEASRILGDATGMPTETLAWWLAQHDPLTAPLDARTVLIVDEASTISDRDLDQLAWLCEQTGTTLRLIGDPDQHGAVEAGGMFRVLCERHAPETPQLTQTHRVLDPHDRAAAAALRRGDINHAIDQLNLAGHLHILDDELDFYRQALTRWWHAHQLGHDHPMVDGRNTVRHRLNRLAHRLLQSTGEVGTHEITATGGRRFAHGDRVIARTPARHLHPPGQPSAYIRNGATGTITALHHGADPAQDTLTIVFDNIGTIDAPRTYFDEHTTAAGTTDVGLDHAYAVTSYAIQGSTRQVSTSRIDQRSTRAELLVDITRGQLANHLYLTPTRHPLDAEQLPRTPPPPIDQTIATRLQHSAGEITAWEVLHKEANRRSIEQRRVATAGL